MKMHGPKKKYLLLLLLLLLFYATVELCELRIDCSFIVCFMSKFYKKFQAKIGQHLFQIFERHCGAEDKLLPSASSMGEAVRTLVSLRSKHLVHYVHCLLSSAQILKLKQRSCS